MAKPRPIGNLTTAQIRKAARSLPEGVPATLTNIAEQAAFQSDDPVEAVKLRPTGKTYGQRTAPAGSIEERVLGRAAQKLRAGTGSMTPEQKRRAGVR